MEIRDRVAGIIIKDHKLLMMQGKSGLLWTPGGKIENNETDEKNSYKVVSSKCSQ